MIEYRPKSPASRLTAIGRPTDRPHRRFVSKFHFQSQQFSNSLPPISLSLSLPSSHADHACSSGGRPGRARPSSGDGHRALD